MVNIKLSIKDALMGTECNCEVNAKATNKEIAATCIALGRTLGEIIKNTPEDMWDDLTKLVVEQMSEAVYK